MIVTLRELVLILAGLIAGMGIGIGLMLKVNKVKIVYEDDYLDGNIGGTD